MVKKILTSGKSEKIKERTDVFLRRLIAERLIEVPSLDYLNAVMFEVLKIYIK